MKAIGFLIFLFIGLQINPCIASPTEYILTVTVNLHPIVYESQNTTSTCQLNCTEPFRFVLSHQMSDVLDQKYEFKRVEELLERRVELNFRQNTETSNNATRVRLQFLSTHPRYGFTESCWTNEMVFPAISDLLVDGRLEQVRTPCFIVKIVAKAFKPRVHWLDSFESSELTSNPHIRYSHVLYSLIITLFIVLFILVPVLLVLKYESERRKARARDALFKFELEHGPSSTSQSYTKLQLNA